jgi:hypothetical protein
MQPLALGGAFLGLVAVPAGAAPIVDGTRDVEYGVARAVQAVQTGFGDNFSELDAAYGVIDGDSLYLMISGNIEANFNRLEIFIDSKAGGQASFDSAGNDGASLMDGLVFDAGFAADYHVIVRRGTNVANPTFDVDFADLAAGTASGYFDILGGLDGAGATGTSSVNAVAIQVGYDGSNTAGVVAGTDAADASDAAAVATGLELRIAVADLGWSGGLVRVMAGMNNASHNYWSNQFLGPLVPPAGNLGGDEAGGFTGEGAVDLTHFDGGQFFTVREAPEPSRVALLATGAAILVAARRRRVAR